VRSITTLSTSDPPPAAIGVSAISTGTCVPSLRSAANSRPNPIGRAIGCAGERATHLTVVLACHVRHQQVDGLADQQLPRISEQRLGFTIDESNVALTVADDQGDWCRLDDRIEQQS